MSDDTFERALAGFGAVEPFQIFSVEFTDGELVEIDSPDALGYKDGVIVFKNPGGIRTVFDCTAVLRMYNATVEEVLELKKHAISNRG
jgi:hypothetical protein